MQPVSTRSIRPLLYLSLFFVTLLGCQQAPPSPTPEASSSPAPSAVVPASSESTATRVGDPADWCGGHAVPESMCPKCNAGVEERFREAGDWCEEHGYPESVCPTCNPMAPPGSHAPSSHDGVKPTSSRIGDASDWCGGHALPESMCSKCNAGVEERFRAAGDWCEEHGFPESACPTCNPMTPPAGALLLPFASGSRVRFRSARLEKTAGIEVTPAVQTAVGLGVECTARIEFNRNRLADVRTAVAGIVREVSVDLGQRVSAGETLFVLESAQVSNLQARRIAAKERVGTERANLARQEDLREKKIPSARQLELARQEVESAEAELRSIDQTLRVTGASQGVESGRFSVKSPISGVIVRRPAMVGSLASSSDSLAEVADLSTMWALLDVNEMDAGAVHLGQPVAVTVDGASKRTFSGLVSWISAEIDSRSRTVAVRAEIPNPDGLLRSNQFARGTIEVADPTGSVSVPAEAIQRMGENSVLFVRTAELVYEPRVVEVGRVAHERVQIEGDVEAGDLVVTTGAFLIKTELMPGSIGAGCCEIDSPGTN